MHVHMAAGETIVLTNAANVQLLCVIKLTGLAPVDVSQDIKTLDFAKRNVTLGFMAFDVSIHAVGIAWITNTVISSLEAVLMDAILDISDQIVQKNVTLEVGETTVLTSVAIA